MLRPLVVTLALTLSLAPARAADPPKKEKEIETITGVVKEISLKKNGITFRKTVEGSYGRQEVTDYRRLGDDCVIAVDGIRGRLAELKPGYLVKIEYEKKTEIAVKVLATTPEAAENERRKKEAMADFERKVQAEHLKVLQKAGEDAIAKQRAAIEKALKDRVAKMKAKNPEDLEKKDGDAEKPKDGEKPKPKGGDKPKPKDGEKPKDGDKNKPKDGEKKG